ncbi:MAG: DUF4296 domain-containing protein [Flavobacteriaceae bacterium]
MNKFCFCFLLKLIFFTSCQNSKEDSIIPQDKMVSMLFDLTIIKSINNLNYEENQLIISPEDFFILQKYNVDSLNWETNKKYYSKRPKLLALIYGRVQDSIEKKIDSLKNLKKR